MESDPKDTVNHAVRYDKFGGTDELYMAELRKPAPGTGQVVIKVKAAGINPGEASIREGRLAQQFPSTFPSGQGTDFAGVVEAVGNKVTDFKPGDEVLGYSHERSSHAEYVAVDAGQVTPRPANISREQAGGLFVAGTTAYAAVKAVELKPGDVLIVSGAAGGVGSLAVQLAKNEGAEVFGFASEPNHAWLKEHGVVPVAYGDDNEKAIREALAGRKPDAFFDASGKGYVELAIKLGIPPNRINTVIDFEAAAKYKVKTAGSAEAATAGILAELAQMISEGKLEMTVAKTYPLTEVRAAFDDLEQRHTRGKIVLIP